MPVTGAVCAAAHAMAATSAVTPHEGVADYASLVLVTAVHEAEAASDVGRAP